SDSNGDCSLDLEGRELRRHRCGRRSAMTAARDTRSMRTEKASSKTASRAKRAKAGKAAGATSRVAGKAGARGGRRPLAPRIAPSDVHGVLARHLLVDGFDLVLDLERSRGRRLWDARSGRWYLDLFSCFATLPVGLNHPKLKDPDFKAKLLRAARANPTNSDI